jgi:hypothetical protein
MDSGFTTTYFLEVIHISHARFLTSIRQKPQLGDRPQP